METALLKKYIAHVIEMNSGDAFLDDGDNLDSDEKEFTPEEWAILQRLATEVRDEQKVPIDSSGFTITLPKPL